MILFWDTSTVHLAPLCMLVKLDSEVWAYPDITSQLYERYAYFTYVIQLVSVGGCLAFGMYSSPNTLALIMK